MDAEAAEDAVDAEDVEDTEGVDCSAYAVAGLERDVLLRGDNTRGHHTSLFTPSGTGKGGVASLAEACNPNDGNEGTSGTDSA